LLPVLHDIIKAGNNRINHPARFLKIKYRISGSNILIYFLMSSFPEFSFCNSSPRLI
jgi:hypothetical protein